MNRWTWRNLALVSAGIGMVAAIATLPARGVQAQGGGPARPVPVFEADPAWPKLPNDWEQIGRASCRERV